MFMSYLWDTIFEINDTYDNCEVFLIDNHIPALRFGTADKPAVFAAGFGAEEWYSSVLLLKFFDELLSHAQNGRNMAGIAVRKAFKKRSLIVVPTVCPSKMKFENQTLKKSDLTPIAKYLSFNKAGMLITVSGNENALFCPASNNSLLSESDIVAKIISACASLPIKEQSEQTGSWLCEWASTKNNLPSFCISPENLKAASLNYTFKSLEEAFVVSALL